MAARRRPGHLAQGRAADLLAVDGDLRAVGRAVHLDAAQLLLQLGGRTARLRHRFGRGVNRVAEEAIERRDGLDRASEIAVGLADVEPQLRAGKDPVGGAELVERGGVIAPAVGRGSLVEQHLRLDLRLGIVARRIVRTGARHGGQADRRDDERRLHQGRGSDGHSWLMSLRLTGAVCAGVSAGAAGRFALTVRRTGRLREPSFLLMVALGGVESVSSSTATGSFVSPPGATFSVPGAAAAGSGGSGSITGWTGCPGCAGLFAAEGSGLTACAGVTDAVRAGRRSGPRTSQTAIAAIATLVRTTTLPGRRVFLPGAGVKASAGLASVAAVSTGLSGV